MKNQDFVNAAVVLGADVADAGTFTVNYPAGYNLGDFENATGHMLVLNGDKLLQPQHIGLSFGAGAVTVTNNTGSTLPQGSKGVFGFQLVGRPAALTGYSSVNKVQRVHATESRVLYIDFGAPATLDADGIWDGISVGAAADTFDSTDMKAATANISGNAAVLDVPRALTLVGSAGADQVVTVNGYDEYDEAVSETLTANSTTPVAGKKAFKTVVSLSVAAGGAASKTLDIGWGDVLGLPVRVTDRSQIIAELQDGTIVCRSADLKRVDFQYTEAELDAAVVRYLTPGFAGYVVSSGIVIENTVTTGGALQFAVNTTDIVGLAPTIADGGTAGTIYTDTPTGDGTEIFAATDALRITPAAAINASAPVCGYVNCVQTNGVFVAGLAKNTKSTATTADVRGTYDPNTACNGAVSFALMVLTAEPADLGNIQYSA